MSVVFLFSLILISFIYTKHSYAASIDVGTCTCNKSSFISCTNTDKGKGCASGYAPFCNFSFGASCGCTCVGQLTQSDVWCGGDTNEYKVINTAIGCIPVGETDFLNTIIGWAIGIGSGVAFLLIVYSGFMIMTSSGSPERLQAGRELLTAAIAGLILLIFSVFILKFIGVDIFGLCKFGFGTCTI